MLKTVVNSIGLLLNIIGAWVVFINSPLHFDVIDSGGAMNNWVTQTKATARKNNRVKYGVYILILGSFLQLVSNFL